MCDVTTLGKIDIKGPDAAELLNRVYTNAWLKLPVGKARYGVMLREDGIVMDDGTTTRISENHYHMTTTTPSCKRSFPFRILLTIGMARVECKCCFNYRTMGRSGNCWTKIKRFITKTISKL